MLVKQAPPKRRLASPKLADFTLEDRYTAQSGRVIMSGIQALARLPMDQHRADEGRGLRTASLITGYRGSPLGALDFALERIPALLEEHHIRFVPAVNEELAATAIMGSQTVNLLPSPSTTASAAYGTARDPALTAAAMPLSTPIWPASASMAACWRWRATTPPASHPPFHRTRKSRSTMR